MSISDGGGEGAGEIRGTSTPRLGRVKWATRPIFLTNGISGEEGQQQARAKRAECRFYLRFASWLIDNKLTVSPSQINKVQIPVTTDSSALSVVRYILRMSDPSGP